MSRPDLTEIEVKVLAWMREHAAPITPKFLAAKAWPETFASPRVAVRAALWQKMGVILHALKKRGHVYKSTRGWHAYRPAPEGQERTA